jgi:hypothetical protein
MVAVKAEELGNVRRPQRESRLELPASDWPKGVTSCEVVKRFEQDEMTIEMVILALQSHQSQWSVFVLGGGDMVDLMARWGDHELNGTLNENENRGGGHSVFV